MKFAKSLIQSYHIWIDNESQLQEDEQLARALQESLNVESPPRYGNGNVNVNVHGNGNVNAHGNGNPNTYQPVPVYYPMGYRYIIYLMEILNCIVATSRFRHYC